MVDDYMNLLGDGPHGKLWTLEIIIYYGKTVFVRNVDLMRMMLDF